MSRLLTFPCHSIWTDANQLTGSIPSVLGELTSLIYLYLRTWIVGSCSYECHACSHFLAILFEQRQMNSQVPFRANSENLPRWLSCMSVSAFVSLVLINVTPAHISFPFYLKKGLINSWVSFRANSENLPCWLSCRSVRGLVCPVRMNVKLAHISLPFYLNRGKSTHGFNSERTRRTYVVDCTVAPYVYWFVLFVWMTR
jgi:hypothetical protein